MSYQIKRGDYTMEKKIAYTFAIISWYLPNVWLIVEVETNIFSPWGICLLPITWTISAVGISLLIVLPKIVSIIQIMLFTSFAGAFIHGIIYNPVSFDTSDAFFCWSELAIFILNILSGLLIFHATIKKEYR
jgi:hypothetical protein